MKSWSGVVFVLILFLKAHFLYSARIDELLFEKPKFSDDSSKFIEIECGDSRIKVW